jgi:hypothetical protein
VTALSALLAGWFAFAAVCPVAVVERGVTVRVEVAGRGGR